MPHSIERATIIGDGAMGTVCGMLLARRVADVRLWGRSDDHVSILRRERCNQRYLPGYHFPKNLTVTADADEAFNGTQLVISAVPCQFMRESWSKLVAHLPEAVPIVSTAKGIELNTYSLPTAILREIAPGSTHACLSGPSIASEVAANKPASVVVAGDSNEIARLVQITMSTPAFRIYTSDDLFGVELAGALKNVIAIAAGISDGIEAGDNAKAALLTRGIVEITRLGVAMGAKEATFRGLAGVGDLFTTCVSKIGRNRTAGERIGRGETVEQIVASTSSVIEGIPTTRCVLELAARHGVEMPIVKGVASVLFEGKKPADAIDTLMLRPLGEE